MVQWLRLHIPNAGDPGFDPWSGNQVAQMVKNSSAVRKTWVQSPGRKDPLEEGIQPTLVFLPGESHEQRSLSGYSPWGHKELDMAERLSTAHRTGNQTRHAAPEIPHAATKNWCSQVNI